MRIWFDTEFWDTGERIELISIGLVREDDAIFYAEFVTPDYVKYNTTRWLADNVAPYLGLASSLWARWAAADAIREFAGDKPEFWACVADYDWVALSQLYGPLVNRPKGWPMTTFDTYQLPNFRQHVIKPDRPHNALSDAIALRKSWLAYMKAVGE